MLEEEKKAEKEEGATEEGDADAAAEESPSASGSKKQLFIVIGGVVLVLAGFVFFFMFTNAGRSTLGLSIEEEVEKVEEVLDIDPSLLGYIKIDNILVNLRSSKGRRGFLKMAIMLEIPSKEMTESIEKIKPRIIDQFQVFLRDLDVKDVSGAPGLERIRQELLRRVNHVVKPYQVSNVLFDEFVIQ